MTGGERTPPINIFVQFHPQSAVALSGWNFTNTKRSSTWEAEPPRPAADFGKGSEAFV